MKLSNTGCIKFNFVRRKSTVCAGPFLRNIRTARLTGRNGPYNRNHFMILFDAGRNGPPNFYFATGRVQDSRPVEALTALIGFIYIYIENIYQDTI